MIPPRAKGVIWQALLIAALLVLAGYVAVMLALNMPRLGMRLGLGFLFQRATFEVGENPLGVHAGNLVIAAFAAGIANTVLVSAAGIILTTLAATAVALARLSHNLAVSRLAQGYIELMRNLPLLLQLLFWDLLLVHALPPPRAALHPISGVFLCNRGLILPMPELPTGLKIAAGLALAAAAGVLAPRAPRWVRIVLAGSGSVVLLVGFLAAWPAVMVDVPALHGFNFRGGVTISPEFIALLWALVTYHTAFAAETIRSGLTGVPRGQIEAADALGLGRVARFRLVILPQALRIILPPMASSYLSLTKDSSLAVAIGYPDLVRVSTVVTSDSGRPIECAAIVLMVYLSLSLATAWAVSRYNARLTARGA